MASTEASRRGEYDHQFMCHQTDPNSIASVASSSEMSLQEPVSGKAPSAKKEKATGGVNLKKSIAKKAKPKDIDGNDVWTSVMLHPC